MTRTATSLQLSLPSPPAVVRTTRQYIRALYAELLSDLDVVERLTMATEELFENVVKYGAPGEASLNVELRREGGHSSLEVSTLNRVSVEARAALQACFDELSAARDATAHYDAVISRSRRRTEGSGLGLARIQAEGEMSLTCHFDASSVVIAARMELIEEGST